MMKKYLLFLLAAGFITFIGCQKELSFELPNTPAEGSLQDDASGDCLPKTIAGAYAVGQALTNSNSITIAVNVTKTGTYAIGTDTVNGYYFRGTGSFTTLGVNNVTLRGNGTPFAQGTNNFVVSFDSTVCDIQVNVTQPGVGTLAGSPNACAPITVNGSYSPGAIMGAGNTAVVQVNVTVAGAFTITTDTVAGIWYTFSGSLGTGTQPVTLQANDTIPAAEATGDKTFRVRLGTSQCTFVVPVVGPGVGTLGGAPAACAPITVNGTYTNGTPLTAGNNVVVQVVVTTAGAFNITTNTQAGFSFAFSGNLNVGTQNVTLPAVGGPPSGTGTQNFTVTLGTSTCTFTVPMAGPAVYTIDCPGVVVNGTYQAGVALNATNTIDLPITVTTAGSYLITASVNGMTFSNSGTLTLGTTSITLNGTGTPTTATGSPFNLSVGTPPCLIPITVTAAPVIDWSFNIGATTYSGAQTGSTFDNTSFPPFKFIDMDGSYGANPFAFYMILADVSGGLMAVGETYRTDAAFPGATNAGYFYFDDLPGLELETDPTTVPAGINITFTISTHDVPNKTITGTFSGTAYDMVSSTSRTITSGTFRIVYP